MKISTRGRYAVRMMLDVAWHQGEGFVTLKDVSERQQISKKYLEQIAILLSKSGMLHAERGHQGGYKLSRPPELYTLDQILETTEGSLAPVACLDQEPNLCERCSYCPTLPVWQGLDQIIQRYLRSITLRDLMKGDLPELFEEEEGQEAEA